jgi:hypothetical protein|tara:strand:- start:19527 stop:19631 length:105 start_codon:yes stop_codon:yes gene_type:complete
MAGVSDDIAKTFELDQVWPQTKPLTISSLPFIFS